MNDDLKEALTDLGYDFEDIIRNQQLLSRYFDSDEERRFHMEGLLGAGTFGLAWKVKYRPPPPDPALAGPVPLPEVRHIVLKTDRVYMQNEDEKIEEEEEEDDSDDSMDDDDSDSVAHNNIWKEKRWLKRSNANANKHHSGTLKKFVNRALEKGIAAPLPNRLLWMFFMCLIRMCIAMGWPPAKPPGENPQPVTERAEGEPHGGLIHGDMHDGNIMFGEMVLGDPDMEHSITPILKLIDFGSMRMVTGSLDIQINAIRENIFDIGAIMVELVTLDQDNAGNIYPSDSNAVTFRMGQNGPEIKTNGDLILPKNGVNPYPRLDPTLRNLICACLAVTPGNRPSLPALANVVGNAVMARNAQFYANNGIRRGESDEEIRSLVNDLILNA
ncbi:hypothetical protein HD806DRAFT_552340 [Xylariaceae sp. AK1471]|nr:hypothetical protein HD806DRAFT_552340 [Xylariaceae sp. AK1471]